MFNFFLEKNLKSCLHISTQSGASIDIRNKVVAGLISLQWSFPNGIFGHIPKFQFGKNRECSDRFGNSRNRFLEPENIGKDTKHGVSSLRESSGKVGIARIVSGIVAIDSSNLKI
ncbi:hypothetical protein NQ317_007423 [Molorchus minor]|uniref:Uncharacterized protein n=1 Tax=Molorchus minor TaxID=1323400 RepID=A0ABQ9JH63_9CUCU|nr:hypothetical protein NQ317_007423 [Molorchus minor]